MLSMSQFKYQTFLSFRGEDTRTGFTDHLYKALKETGVRTFRDDRMRIGEIIDAEIKKAIRASESSVIVISQGFASSRWCLDELVEILDRNREFRHKVVPVFYLVDPDHVSAQTGSFGEAFHVHVKKFEEDIDMVNRWKEALVQVAGHSGLVLLQHQYEATFIKRIVKEVQSKINPAPKQVPSFVVGLDSCLQSITSWLQTASNDVGVCMIYGDSGVGKTTLAKLVFNKNFNYFESASFVSDIGQTLVELEDIILIQAEMLFGIQRKYTGKIKTVVEGARRIKKAARGKRVLIVLDGVDEINHFGATIVIKNWLCKGSKIIVTTRNEKVVAAHSTKTKIKVETLDESDSLRLFSWHAFGQTHPNESMIEWSRSAVKHCCGLPLAIEVLTLSLSRKSMEAWEAALPKLEETDAGGKIEQALRISYDVIEKDALKNFFLNIACFFVGAADFFVSKALWLDRNRNEEKLYGEGDYVDINSAMEYLCNRGFINIEDDILKVHQLLSNMATDILRQDPGRIMLNLGSSIVRKWSARNMCNLY